MYFKQNLKLNNQTIVHIFTYYVPQRITFTSRFLNTLS